MHVQRLLIPINSLHYNRKSSRCGEGKKAVGVNSPSYALDRFPVFSFRNGRNAYGKILSPPRDRVESNQNGRSSRKSSSITNPKILQDISGRGRKIEEFVISLLRVGGAIGFDRFESRTIFHAKAERGRRVLSPACGCSSLASLSYTGTNCAAASMYRRFLSRANTPRSHLFPDLSRLTKWRR